MTTDKEKLTPEGFRAFAASLIGLGSGFDFGPFQDPKFFFPLWNFQFYQNSLRNQPVLHEYRSSTHPAIVNLPLIGPHPPSVPPHSNLEYPITISPGQIFSPIHGFPPTTFTFADLALVGSRSPEKRGSGSQHPSGRIAYGNASGGEGGGGGFGGHGGGGGGGFGGRGEGGGGGFGGRGEGGDGFGGRGEGGDGFGGRGGGGGGDGFGGRGGGEGGDGFGGRGGGEGENLYGGGVDAPENIAGSPGVRWGDVTTAPSTKVSADLLRRANMLIKKKLKGPTEGAESGSSGPQGGPGPPTEKEKVPAVKKPSIDKKPPVKKPPPQKPPEGVKAKAKAIRRIPWEALDSSDSTVFSTAAVPKSVMNADEIREAFTPQVNVVQPTEAKPRSDVVRLLPDPRRAQNISIGVNRIMKLGVNKLRYALQILDSEVLDETVTDIILNHVPNTMEIHAVQNYVNGGGIVEKMDTAEQFVYTVMDIPHLRDLLGAHHFSMEMDRELDEFFIKLDRVSKACDDLLNAEKIQALLSLILKAGNLINNENMHGFKLSSLPKVTEVKTATVPKRTLLEGLVEILYLSKPEKLDLFQEAPTLREAATVDLADLEQAAKQFVNLYKTHCTKTEKLFSDGVTASRGPCEFLKAVREQVENLVKTIEKVKNQVNDVMEFYGDRDCKLGMQLTFRILFAFIKAVEAAKLDCKNKVARKIKGSK